MDENREKQMKLVDIKDLITKQISNLVMIRKILSRSHAVFGVDCYDKTDVRDLRDLLILVNSTSARLSILHNNVILQNKNFKKVISCVSNLISENMDNIIKNIIKNEEKELVRIVVLLSKSTKISKDYTNLIADAAHACPQAETLIGLVENIKYINEIICQDTTNTYDSIDNICEAISNIKEKVKSFSEEMNQFQIENNAITSFFMSLAYLLEIKEDITVNLQAGVSELIEKTKNPEYLNRFVNNVVEEHDCSRFREFTLTANKTKDTLDNWLEICLEQQ